MLLNPVASTISKRRKFSFVRSVQLLNRFVGLDEMLCGGDGIEYYLDYILLNPVALTIPKRRTFELLRWVLLLNRLVDLEEILRGVMALNIVCCKLM
jgi:hypothetical protein